MARIRSIKPEFWTSEQIMECSLIARLLFIGMWNFADDLGRLPLSPKTIKALIFPSDVLSLDTILGMIQELSKNDLVLPYSVEGKDYLQITGWQHQRIDKPQPGKYPSPVNGYSKTILGTVATERKGEEEIGKDSSDEADASSDAGASIDHRKRLFTEGLAKVAAMTGKGPDACRSFLGKCLKEAGDDAVVVLGLLEDAERNQVIDPAAWIAARLKTRENPHGRRTVHEAARDQTQRLLAELDEPTPSRLCEPEGGGPVRLLPPGRRERS